MIITIRSAELIILNIKIIATVIIPKNRTAVKTANAHVSVISAVIISFYTVLILFLKIPDSLPEISLPELNFSREIFLPLSGSRLRFVK